MTALLAAVLAGMAVLAFGRRGPARPSALRAAQVGAGPGAEVDGVGSGPWSRARVLTLTGTAGIAASVVTRGPTLLLVLVAIGVALASIDLLRRQRVRRTAQVAALRATEFCEALAAELLAGGAPAQVLVSAAQDFPEFEAACAADRLGADVAQALRRMSKGPGLSDLRLVAGAWHVSHRSGAGLAESLDRVARTLRDRRRTGRLIAAELAAAYATARIMAALPVVFVLVGSGLGARPLDFLTGGTGGVLCLACGLLLTWAGLAWLQRIGDGVGTP